MGVINQLILPRFFTQIFWPFLNARTFKGDGLRRLMGQLAEPNSGWIPIFDPETGSGAVVF